MGPGRKKILILLILIAGVALLASLWQWVDTIPLGIAVAVILVPLQHRLSSRIPEGISAALITLIILSLGIAGVLFTVTVMQENFTTNQEILMKAAGGITILAPQFAGFGIPAEAIGETTARIQGIVGAVETFWSGLTLTAAILNVRVLFFLFSLFLSLWAGDRVLRGLLLRTPQEWMGTYHRMATVSVDTLHAVLVVHLLIVALTFGLSIPFYWVLGYGHVLYLSLTTALCELVPVLGASIPMVILLLYSFAIGDLRGFFLVFFIGYLVVALLPELSVRPILMGRRTHISPYLMFVGFLGGILLLGISGFLLGPLALALAASWYRLRRLQGAGSSGNPA
ncbi:MAG: AI-2E family transporter [Methanomicrobiales archaeon]|nr:AI-2E family transporter [Methanomicrobiales archaeon]